MDRKIYDSEFNVIENPDLKLGWLRETTYTVHHPAVAEVKEKWHYEIIKEYPNGGKDVKKVIDVEGVVGHDAWSEDTIVYVYVPYTPEELAEIEERENAPTVIDRLEAQVLYTAMITDTLLEV